MEVLLIFGCVWGAMVAMAFWEAYVEGRNAWDKGKLGWKIRVMNGFTLTAYHFFLFWVMFPLLLALPFVVSGWDARLFGIIASAYFSGMVLEDFLWFVVNPVVSMKEWDEGFASFHAWIKFGRFRIPAGYVLGIAAALLSWWFLWR